MRSSDRFRIRPIISCQKKTKGGKGMVQKPTAAGINNVIRCIVGVKDDRTKYPSHRVNNNEKLK